MKKVIFFSNGNTAVFDEQGEQVPSLQEGWFRLFLDFLKMHGVNPLDAEYTLPNGQKAKPFKTKTGYNWEVN